MALIVTRDGIRTEDQLRDEAAPPPPEPTDIAAIWCSCGDSLYIRPGENVQCPRCQQWWLW